MRSKPFLYRSLLILLVLVVTIPLSSVRAQGDVPPEETPTPGQVSVDVVNEYYTAVTTTLSDGTTVTADVINGPPEPPNPVAWEASRVSISSLDRAATMLPNFPAYSWVFGCSAVSGAMIAGYYDNNGYSNMYAGPTNGGVMPLTDTSWSMWSDGQRIYPNNPLIASHAGIDGHSGNGSIEDYWVSYLSNEDDPYLTGSWAQHVWDSAIGDYMKTSQSAYGNIDGNTVFWNYTSSSSPLTCSTMEFNNWPDGTLGRKEFYEARGYTVTDCYNQRTDNIVAGGFSLAQFQAEIDAGRPVFINLEGHSVVGYGYDGDKIYIRDTWDNDTTEMTHYMMWGEFYPPDEAVEEDRMYMRSVSIVHLSEVSPDFSKLSPTDQSHNLNPSNVTLSWEASSGATGYEYCLSDSAFCSSWTSNGVSTSVSLSGLAGGGTFYWQARATSAPATVTYANGGAYWQFTTFDPAIMTENAFIPLILH